MGNKRRYGCLLLLALPLLLAGLVLAPALPKLDYSAIPTRASWQLPNEVIDALALEPGDSVADIGAGDGYFTFRLADAVGPDGRVYALDVVESIVEELRREVESRGYENIEVVLAPTDDPGLPSGEIDLAFVCNVYHHIDDRVLYFDRLRPSLTPDGRIAIIEPLARAPLRWLSPPGHTTPIEKLEEEMRSVQYDVSASFDFLPVQNFVIFASR